VTLRLVSFASRFANDEGDEQDEEDVTCCYKHEIVFLHLDRDHVTVSHFRRNYLCSTLRAATSRDATGLRRSWTNRIFRYAKAVTDQNKTESNISLLLISAYVSRL